MYLDPSLDEEQSMSLKAASNDAMDTEESGALSGGSLTVGLMPLYAKGQMPLMVQSGTISLDQLYEGIDAGLDSCRKVYAIVKQVRVPSSFRSIQQSIKLKFACNCCYKAVR